MQLPALWLVTLVVLAMMTGGAQMTRSEEVFTNAFLVELKDRHGNDVANEVAKRNGFTNMGPVSTNIASHMHVSLSYVQGPIKPKRGTGPTKHTGFPFPILP